MGRICRFTASPQPPIARPAGKPVVFSAKTRQKGASKGFALDGAQALALIMGHSFLAGRGVSAVTKSVSLPQPVFPGLKVRFRDSIARFFGF